MGHSVLAGQGIMFGNVILDVVLTDSSECHSTCVLPELSHARKLWQEASNGREPARTRFRQLCTHFRFVFALA